MKVLVAWDDANEAELLPLYLGAGEHTTVMCSTVAEALAQVEHGPWDVVLFSLALPNAEGGFTLFTRLKELLPGVPLMLACRTGEMLNLPRFLINGLRFYLVRDAGGDFVFLLLASLESAIAASHAEEASKLAERLREEMDGVRRLQESIIPQGLQPPAGYLMAARYESSQVSVVGERPVVMAGGDYYDIFRPDEQTLVVLIGDASGHGLKACMSIMVMHTLVRMMTGARYRDTAGFVAEINRRLCENSIVQSGGGFITLMYAAIDTVSHTLTWTSAGHPLLLLHRLGENAVVPVGSEADGGLPLGIMAEAEYGAASVPFLPGSRLLFYTDGLTDAFPVESSKHQTLFGVPGIVAALQACRESELKAVLDHLFEASHKFTGGSGRHDDTSAVLLEHSAAAR